MIDLEKFPEEVRYCIKKDIETYGEWATSWLLAMAPFCCMSNDLKSTDSDIVWMTVAFQNIRFYSNKDPSLFHFRIARDFLKNEFKEEPDDKAVDLLARKLVKACEEFFDYIVKMLYAEEIDFPLLEALSDEKGYLVPESFFVPGFIYEKDGCNLLDVTFANYLSSVGETGMEAAARIIELSKKKHGKYKESNYSPETRHLSWWLWINKQPNEQTTIWSNYVNTVLVEVIWKDRCLDSWQKERQRGEKNVPALTHCVHLSVTKILSHSTQTQTINNCIHMINSGKIIAIIPTIDQRLMTIVTKGAGSLNSIYHHKLIRYECRVGFENWVQNKPDIRVLSFEGGCSEITERLGLTSNRANEEIKAILHAQAFMHFNFEDGSSGNLIALRHFRSRGCNRDDGIEIVLGTQLLPHYTFKAPKKERLLIPVPELPPLVSAPQYHSGQALLQMMIMEEFTEQSIMFVNQRSIEILPEKWEKFAKETGLPNSVFRKVMERWVRDGDDGPRFLITVDRNHYALGESYKKETQFLECQGALRKSRQRDGELSAKLRKKRSKS